MRRSTHNYVITMVSRLSTRHSPKTKGGLPHIHEVVASTTPMSPKLGRSKAGTVYHKLGSDHPQVR